MYSVQIGVYSRIGVLVDVSQVMSYAVATDDMQRALPY